MSFPIATPLMNPRGKPSLASKASPPHKTYGEPNAQTSAIASLGAPPRSTSIRDRTIASEPPKECPVIRTFAFAPNRSQCSRTAHSTAS